MVNMSLSKKNTWLLRACEKGFKIDSNGTILNKYGKTIKGQVDRNYMHFCFRDKDGNKNITVHRLQAYQKFGDKIFEKGIQVRHLNGNSLDNSWDNIEIGTISDNAFDKSEETRKRVAIIASRKQQNSIRSYEERCLIYDDLIKGLSLSKIMKKHNISSKGALSYMKNKSQEFKEYLNKKE